MYTKMCKCIHPAARLYAMYTFKMCKSMRNVYFNTFFLQCMHDSNTFLAYTFFFLYIFFLAMYALLFAHVLHASFDA